MTDGAFELFKNLSSYARIKELVDEGEAEGLLLECKSLQGPRLSSESKKHLAKAISGFSNTAGGVIIYGVSTTNHAHSGLDILSQIEPIANCKTFEQQVRRTIPTITTPPCLTFQTAHIYEKKKDTRGLVVVYIPEAIGDPVQSAIDNLFYLRTGDEFSIAPHDVIKKLFSANESPDLFPVFISELVTSEEDGTWKIPLGVGNTSSAAADNVTVSVVIKNASSCGMIKSGEFNDASGINPGKKIFMLDLKKVVHRGLHLMVGDFRVKMKVGRRPKRRLDLAITLYANNMRAKTYDFTVTLAKSGFKVSLVNEKYLY